MKCYPILLLNRLLLTEQSWLTMLHVRQAVRPQQCVSAYYSPLRFGNSGQWSFVLQFASHLFLGKELLHGMLQIMWSKYLRTRLCTDNHNLFLIFSSSRIEPLILCAVQSIAAVDASTTSQQHWICVGLSGKSPTFLRHREILERLSFSQDGLSCFW